VSLATPGEAGEIEIETSSQNLSKTQVCVLCRLALGDDHQQALTCVLQYIISNVLGTPTTRTLARVKRIGGGFGGKETRSIMFSAAAAVAAQATGKPVRMVIDRHFDMLMTGGRHPFYSKYKIGFTNDGRIQAGDFEMYANGGCTVDLSIGVLDRYACINLSLSLSRCVCMCVVCIY
jgi:xanthine dehydrogenase molybdopterin-binding subunit B